MVTENDFVAAEAAKARANDEFDSANARADRAQGALGRLQCRFSWRPNGFRSGWPVLRCGRPAGHEGTHDARFYLEEDQAEEFADAVDEWVFAAVAADKAATRLLETWSAVERLERPEVTDEACSEEELDRILESMEAMERREWEESRHCEGAEVVDEFAQYPLDGFWDPRWGSSLSETEADEREEQPPSHR
ncbi:hypothetical protein [Brevibacterium sp. SMBL_HHYL_HB1]|uniref:hypothetical protein n=1 Tax=Brevibacterium sp. SMBL_HHYL_HB1 TaxID=2777556 RepID=UPI001BA51EC0|nr:hypothetical protein [Brevibacterium sp. SMBL_HHYL_HB1]QUL78058.1 hypothetical protein IG171_11255 [Brevibacterium sp. SMBL_HHYL_HB1]